MHNILEMLLMHWYCAKIHVRHTKLADPANFNLDMMQQVSYRNNFYHFILRCLAAGMLFTMHHALLVAQQNDASISESWVDLKTYGFHDPDPSPILMDNPGIYPYHTFEGYNSEGQDSSWKVVKLENQYIEVYVLPQIGGKVWGAIEKSTGEEFIYRNEVMKFRNISMRGPWTSGGIEFNFGVIGHHPATATPVDYKLHENQDGSVSCTVGNIDLPSRTQWRVEVLLAPDKAFFETRVVWYNPTSSTQSYYNWMTGAAVASDDLTFYCPGDGYLDHPGGIHSWPINEEGRDISQYANNNFGGSKSYHVVGVHDDFFGGYYADRNVGFGHWSPYESMPGQKLWLWALSRSGGIWEDLLTDTDGQYIEFQAGRLLNQFSPGGKSTPITKVGFEPGATDIWREIWFPVKAIGGLTSVSTKGVLHVIEVSDSLQLGLNALSKSVGPVLVYDGDDLLYEGTIQMEPMDVQYFTVPMPKRAYTIEIPGMDIQYMSDASSELSRPYESKQDVGDAGSSSTDQLFRQAQQQLRMRKYQLATNAVMQCLQADPFHLQGLTLYADLLYRSGDYAEARKEIEKALSIDTYAPESNFVAGKIYRKLDQVTDALEAYGWSARSMEFRSAGYALMAEIYLQEGEIQNAVNYARNALDFNRFHVGARYVLTIAARMVGNISAADRQIQTLLAIDPLNHFALMEQYFLGRTSADSIAALEAHRSEMPYQTFMELAVLYHQLGQDRDALQVLNMAPAQPLVQLWRAYLQDQKDDGQASEYLRAALEKPITFVFPYRLESLPILKWALEEDDHWKIQYYYALNLWGVGQVETATRLLKEIGQEADMPFFYRTRAYLLADDEMAAFQDLQHALEMNKSDWRSWMSLIQLHDRQDDVEAMLTTSREAYERLPNNYTVGMAHTKALIGNGLFEESLDVLGGLQVLPFEGARAGRSLWEQAHIGAALDHINNGHVEQALPTLIDSKKWPEHLGVGKPYQPDEFLVDYLIGHCYGLQGDNSKKRAVWKELQKGDHTANDTDTRELLVERATASLAKLASSTHDENLVRQVGPWSIALSDGNKTEIEKLEAAHPVVAAEIEYLIWKRSLLLGVN